MFFFGNSSCIFAKINGKIAPSEVRTHDLEIMRLARCLLRYRGIRNWQSLGYSKTTKSHFPCTIFELARSRTWNLLIRSQARYPLRHKPLYIPNLKNYKFCSRQGHRYHKSSLMVLHKSVEFIDMYTV